MSVLEEREDYLKNPFFKKHEYEDYTAFYVTITIVTIFGLGLFLLNIFLGCCSNHSSYWNKKHTGNRWLVSLWTATPHNQPPLDCTELETIYVPPPPPPPPAPQAVYESRPSRLNPQTRESEI